MPGSRYFHFHDEITRGLGVRLITVDRPGYGSSTFQPNRSILDWPSDISRLADTLGLQKFSVAGHSGGGPYALACAVVLPQRVTLAATLCGAGPAGIPHATRGMKTLDGFGFRFGRFIPWPLWWWMVQRVYRRKLKPILTDAKLPDSHRPPADDALMELPEVRSTCIASENEAFRPGLLGFAWDVRLLTRPWGFRLEEIKVPVSIWHGTADNMTPLTMARAVASRLQKRQTHYCEGEGHLLIFSHWQEILTELIME
jgi:pimeloyl-ACP methyl ester carboxylesterase